MVSPESNGSSAAKSRRQTELKLKDAIDSLQAAGSKVSISAVAKAASVTPALIHNTYPDLAERIRGLMGKNTRMQRDAKHDALVHERERNRALRAEIEGLRAEMAKLASLNLTLLSKVAVLNGLVDGKVVSFLPPELNSK